ncbi:MAG TPA: (2Fe-2S)-binding protein [Methylophilaceae bacterium]|nr:(2Fe-2S)-binding protein [Methylophilaceae bacterium]
MNTNPPEPPDEVLCACSGTTRGEIECLFRQGLDMDGISRWTGMLTGCGGCEWEIVQLLKALGEQQGGGA